MEYQETHKAVLRTVKLASHKICLRFNLNSGFVCHWVLSLQDSYLWAGETNREVDEYAAKMMSPKWNGKRAMKFWVVSTCFEERVTEEGEKLWEKYIVCLSMHVHEIAPGEGTLWDIWLKGNDCLIFSVGCIILYCDIFGNRKTEEGLIPSIKAHPIRKMREFTFCSGWNQLLFWRLMLQSIIIIFSGEHNYAWGVWDEPDCIFGILVLTQNYCG